MRWWVIAACMALAAVSFDAQRVAADSLRVQPLQYTSELKKGERKKGHVDITNPSNASVEAKFYVQAFRQVDNKGNLAFFASEQLEKGLLLDYDTVTIGPRQTLRLFFIADGTKLPTGDVFGVIFAETTPLSQAGAKTSVRVGALVILTNQTPGPRKTEISNLSVPFFQTGDDITGSMTLRNPAPKDSATGFFPMIDINVSPWGAAMQRQGPLIFASHERAVDFELPSNAFGLYEISVQANDARKTSWVFLITGWWQIVTPVLVVILVAAIIYLKKYRHRIKTKIPKYRRKKRSIL